MYLEEHGEIQERFPHMWCGCSMSRLESLPFYHAYPGARVLTIGTSSCNMSCRYCSNAYVAKEDPAWQQSGMAEYSAKELVRLAEKLECHAIVFNVNEPTVSLLSLEELAVEARRAGLPMGCLTNGYMTEEGTERLARIFSFVNVAIKGLSDDFCRQFLGIPTVDSILRNIRALARTHHLEITTPIIQGVNDRDIDAIAGFLASVDPEIPWHVFRLLPEHDMKESEYPSIDGINQALQSARQRLPYVYFHNFVGSDWVNTLCPGCGVEVIERFSLGCGGDRLSKYHCEDGRCPKCRTPIRIHGERIAWGTKRAVTR